MKNAKTWLLDVGHSFEKQVETCLTQRIFVDILLLRLQHISYTFCQITMEI